MFESAVHEDEVSASGEVIQEAGHPEIGSTGEYTGEGEWSPEAGYEGAYEGAYESGLEGEDPFLGNILGALGGALGLGEGEGAPEAGYETGFETGYESAFEGEGSPEAGYEGAYETAYEGEDPFLGNILGAIGGALGLGEGEGAGEAAFESGFESGHETGYEGEWSPESAYETGYEGEDPFLGNILGAIGGALGLGEGEWAPEAGYESAYETGYEGEWAPESAYETGYETGYEGEDPFFGRILKAAKSLVPRLIPFARQLAPQVLGALRGMLPGPLGAIAGQLVREGEVGVLQAEERLFGSGESSYELGGAHPEAVLTEVLAAEAANARTDSEAASVISATLPVTITIMGGRRALRPVVPVMAQATSRLVRVLRRRGPAGRQLIRLIPAIQRQAVATLAAANRAGAPITTPRAVAAIASAANRVLNNPRRVTRIVVRNAALSRRPIVLTQMGPAAPVRRAAPFRGRRSVRMNGR